MALNLKGGVAVVTGAASGIGLGIATAAAEAGMSLVIADISPARLSEVRCRFEHDGIDVLAVETDVADAEAVDRLATLTLERFGPPRLLVNNAGIEVLGDIWELSADQWQRAININVLGPVFGLRAFIPHMISSPEPSCIANVSSIGGLGIAPVQAPYIVSRHATLSLTECLYMELIQRAPHINVSVVMPGFVNTRIFEDADALGQVPHVLEHLQEMRALLESQGITPEVAGRTILAQIADGQFWVSTHPDLTRRSAAVRADYLSHLRRPNERKSMQ